jgi:hypothetical protein
MFHENRSTCSKTKTGDTHFRQGGDLSGQSHRNVELATVKPGGIVLKNLGLKDFMRHTARHGRPSGEPVQRHSSFQQSLE